MLKLKEAEPPRRYLVQDLCKEPNVHLALDGFIHLVNLYDTTLLAAMGCPEAGNATVNKVPTLQQGELTYKRRDMDSGPISKCI